MNADTNPTPEPTPIPATPGHTVGPFFHNALGWASAGSTADDPALGAVQIEGTVEDAAGERLPAWLLEAWVPQSAQAEAQAGRRAPGFRRLMSDSHGKFAFRVPPPAPGQPAAFVTLFGLGLTRHQFSAVFLDATQVDGGMPSILDAVPPSRRATLVAECVGEDRYRWTIRTQGDSETVFLDYR
jgi:protocatechuate 3,4-dioxygenase alpha subunit